MTEGEDRITATRDSAQAQTWTFSETRTFVYDLPAMPALGTQSQALQAGGWNCIFERRVDATQTVTDAAYVWGLDLSGSMQGPHSTGSGPSAGGVGGLLQASTPTNVGGALRAAIFYVYDGSRPRTSGGDGLSKGAQRATEGSSEPEGRTATSGNVTALVDAADGSVVAHYDYSPFGVTVLADGPAAAANRWRFSTKYHDPETSLVYYGYRYYSPELGRWINRDPIGGRGEPGLCTIVGNTPTMFVDSLGLVGVGFVSGPPMVGWTWPEKSIVLGAVATMESDIDGMIAWAQSQIAQARGLPLDCPLKNGFIVGYTSLLLALQRLKPVLDSSSRVVEFRQEAWTDSGGAVARVGRNLIGGASDKIFLNTDPSQDFFSSSSHTETIFHEFLHLPGVGCHHPPSWVSNADSWYVSHRSADPYSDPDFIDHIVSDPGSYSLPRAREVVMARAIADTGLSRLCIYIKCGGGSRVRSF
jgi:RHS repeat-associated protein